MKDGRTYDRSSLSETSEIFCYLFCFVAFAFILDFVYYAVLPFVLIVPLFFILKVYFYSGLFGTILELLSEEEFMFHWDKFHQNALKFWPHYVILSLLPYVIPILLKYIFSGVDVHFSLAFASHSKWAILFGLAYWMIAVKYLTPKKIKARKILVNEQTSFVIIGFFLLDALFFYLPKMVNLEQSYWTVVFLGASRFLYFFGFIYFANLILKEYSEIKKSFDHEKEVFMINPMIGGILKSIAIGFFRGYPPVFVVFKALTPKEYSFVEFNRNFWQERYYKSKKLVAITCFSSNCYEAYKIAKEFKKRGSTVVMGGPHVTYLPDEALSFCDSVVVGEAEGVWEELMQDYEKGELKQKYTGVAKEDYHKAVHAQLLKSPPSVIKEFLEPTRGCKYRCHFCTIPMISKGKVRKKPVPEMIELLKKLGPGHQWVNLLDNNIYNDPAYSKELFKAMKPLNIKWQSFATIDIAKNNEILKLAKESGCFMFVFGYEIFGGSLENEKGGKFAMADRYIRYSQNIRKAGISIRGNFIYGWDSDNLINIFKMWKFSFLLNPSITLLGLLTPLPGSKLYYDMLREDRIINQNWRKYDAFALVFKHKDAQVEMISKFFYPVIPLFFFLTTSRVGHIFIAVIAFVFLYMSLFI